MNFIRLVLLSVLLSVLPGQVVGSSVNEAAGETTCEGRFLNPVSDVCWKCIFPISISGASITMGQESDGGSGAAPICVCPAPPPVFVKFGIAWSFWEPAHMIEVVRKPYCSPAFGGISLGNMKSPPGHHHQTETSRRAHYQLHYLQYPLMYVLGMVKDSLCESGSGGSVDLLYMTEIDPTWQDDELAFLMNPESALFANVPLQATCIADCAAATLGFPLDELFWCAGCNGALYPMAGTTVNHLGGLQTSLQLSQRLLAKLHRMMLAQDTSSQSTMCSDQTAYILPKRQYKTQIVYPIPRTSNNHPLGRSSSIWGVGQEYPVKGENWVHLIWRKYLCCSTY